MSIKAKQREMLAHLVEAKASLEAVRLSSEELGGVLFRLVDVLHPETAEQRDLAENIIEAYLVDTACGKSIAFVNACVDLLSKKLEQIK